MPLVNFISEYKWVEPKDALNYEFGVPDEVTFPYGTFVSLHPIVQSEGDSFGGLFTLTAGENNPRPVANLFVSGEIDGKGKHTLERAHYRSHEMNAKQVFTGIAALAMSTTSKLSTES